MQSNYAIIITCIINIWVVCHGVNPRYSTPWAIPVYSYVNDNCSDLMDITVYKYINLLCVCYKSLYALYTDTHIVLKYLLYMLYTF